MNVYKDLIMDHYKDPQNWGVLAEPDITVSGSNPLCGDLINLKVKLKDGLIEEIRFIASGCALSIASTSILTETVKGKKAASIEKLDKKELLDILGIELGPNRLKCALLSLDALKQGLRKYAKEK